MATNKKTPAAKAPEAKATTKNSVKTATVAHAESATNAPAKHGGQAVRDKYGLDFFAQIGKRGGQTVKERRGPEFYAQIGRRGGESTKQKYGSDFYSEIGRKGGSTTRKPKAVVK
jgi:general stress protein YciG